MESMGVASGCGCKEVYRLPHTREMQSINGASLRVLDSLIERIVLKIFES